MCSLSDISSLCPYPKTFWWNAVLRISFEALYSVGASRTLFHLQSWGNVDFVFEAAGGRFSSEHTAHKWPQCTPREDINGEVGGGWGGGWIRKKGAAERNIRSATGGRTRLRKRGEGKEGVCRFQMRQK